MRQCYGWQVGQQSVECWEGRLREELDTTELGYILQNGVMDGRLDSREWSVGKGD